MQLSVALLVNRTRAEVLFTFGLRLRSLNGCGGHRSLGGAGSRQFTHFIRRWQPGRFQSKTSMLAALLLRFDVFGWG
jgi:hypothetical protein